LDRWRPFQSQVPLRDQVPHDSGLEVLPGIHLFLERYYQLGHPGEGLNIPPRHYNCNIKEETNSDLIELFIYVKRIPKDWDHTKLPALPSRDEINKMDSRKEIVSHISSLKTEIRKFEGSADYPKAGDFIIWDMRSAHQNGVANNSKQVRQTFYHAYVPAGQINAETINGIRNNREMGKHPPDFPKSHAHIEDSFDRHVVGEIGNLLYNYAPWQENTRINDNNPTYYLTDTQINFFRRYGYVVIENCIPEIIIRRLNTEISNRFNSIAGIDTNNLLKSTKEQWKRIGTKFGGTIELYYCPAQDEIRCHLNCYWIIVQLLEKTWFDKDKKELGFDHPFEDLNPRHLWIYCDRMNYRLPEDLKKIIQNK